MKGLSKLAATMCCLIALSACLSGCASMAEGITRALISDEGPEEDTRQCHIRGPAFEGVADLMDKQSSSPTAQASRDLKVLMVHGIGTHLPGYSTLLQENLAEVLNLHVVSERPKEIVVQQPLLFPNEKLGLVWVNHYASQDSAQSLTFYELTWSGITEPEKSAIAYDTSGEYSFRRAGLNQMMKSFINSHIPDPLIYLGDTHVKIQAAVAQTFCWMVHYDWKELPLSINTACPLKSLTAQHLHEDDYVFISHSLGSRIVIDSLQRLAEMTSKEHVDPRLDALRVPPAFLAAMREEEFTMFMFANQLPLLQLGREPPAVVGEIDNYCSAAGDKQDQRFMKRLNIIAFSDPNDILSWAVPPDYPNKYMDSRLCPAMDNVIINVAKVMTLFDTVELANPAEAHAQYNDDERVMSLIARGVGTRGALPLVKDRCEWLETQ